VKLSRLPKSAVCIIDTNVGLREHRRRLLNVPIFALQLGLGQNASIISYILRPNKSSLPVLAFPAHPVRKLRVLFPACARLISSFTPVK